MRRFQLNRQVDHTGVAGTGIVAEGVMFTNGTCAVRWMTVPKGMTYVPRSIGFYESITHVEAVHGHGGDTAIEWLD